MTTKRTRMLGRLPSQNDRRTIRFDQIARPWAITLPPAVNWDKAIAEWGVAGNDRYGNCVIATAAHLLLTWRANESHDARPITDQAVIALSREMGALDGYNILDRLKYWRTTGMFGDNLWAFTSLSPQNIDHVKLAIFTLGAADIGVNLPRAWQNADEWDVGYGPAYRPGTWGGHSVPHVGYDANNVYAVTWGQIIPMTWPALAYYCDEAYALIDSQWITQQGKSPVGLDLPSLHAALCDIDADDLDIQSDPPKRS